MVSKVDIGNSIIITYQDEYNSKVMDFLIEQQFYGRQ
jgi:hypothetical protein